MAADTVGFRPDADTRERLDELETKLDVSTSKAVQRALDRGLATYGVGTGTSETGTLLGDFALEGARLFGYGAVVLFWAAEQFDVAASFALVAMFLLAVQQRAAGVVRGVDRLTLGRFNLDGEAEV